MPTEEKIQEQVKILTTETLKLLKTLDPNMEEAIEQMDGIAIFMFPTDHEKNGAVRATMMGRVCCNCIVKTLKTVEAERGKERMPIA